MSGCWSEIEKLEGHTLCVLARRNPFDVVEVSEDYAVVRPHVRNISRQVPRREIEAAYADLLSSGQISARQIKERHADWHSAFVCAMLAELPGITYSLNPITLYVGAAQRAQLAFEGDSAFIPAVPPIPSEISPAPPPVPATAAYFPASGQRLAFAVVAELVRRGFEVYLPAVAEGGSDCILRLEGEADPCWLELRIETRTADASPAKAALFAGLEIPDPRPGLAFIFCAALVDAYWVVPSHELVEMARQYKRGKNKGKYTINFCHVQAGHPVPDPQYAAYQDAFHRLGCQERLRGALDLSHSRSPLPKDAGSDQPADSTENRV
jgi:hypothetical protein